MNPLVECVHPDLGDDRVVLMPGGPRNGWQERIAAPKPVAKKAAKHAAKKTTRPHGAAGSDSPTAGPSTTITKDEE